MMHRRCGESVLVRVSVLSERICSIGDRCRVVLCSSYVAVEWLRGFAAEKPAIIVASVRK